MKAFGRSPRLGLGVLLLVLGVLLGGSLTVLASHQFSDVPTAAIYHDAVEWLVNRGITLGCAAGLFCPNDVVTRAQMALFLQRLGGALTPTFLSATGMSDTTLDLDVSPTVCSTTTNYTPPFPQAAVVHSRVSVVPTASLDYWVFSAYSTDGGATWTEAEPVFSVETRSTGTGHAPNFNIGEVNLVPGTNYRFGMRLVRAFGPISGGGGTGDLAKHWCALHVEVINRNPTSSPFGGPSRTTRQGR